MQKQSSNRPSTNSNIKDKVKIDLIVIGNPNSGKTSLIKRFIQGQSIININNNCIASFSHFYTPTLGLSLQRKTITIQQTQVTVCIWDTAGIQKYWINQVKQKSDQNCTAILIGNKSDLTGQRVIKKQQTQDLQNKLEIKYFQTSARNGQNVQQAIEYMVKQCMKKVKDSQPRGVEVEVRKTNNQQGRVRGCFGGVKQIFTGVWDKFKQ